MRFVKITAVVLSILTAMLCFASCGEDGVVNESTYYTVTFNSAGGDAVEGMRVLSGSKIAQPVEPEKEGYIFNGWKKDTVSWNFDVDVVTSNITLTASWIDATTVFEYTVNEGKAVLTKYIGSMRIIKLPKVIGGYPVSAVGDEAFANTSSEKTSEIILGENIVSVGRSAFYGCSGISIIIEGKLQNVSEKAFLDCDKLERVEFGEGAETIPYQAFSGCTALKSVVLSKTVSKIEENAFEACSALQNLIAHNSLKNVEDSAFVDCSALKVVYYYGTAQDWAATAIAEGNNGNDTLIGAKFYMYSETEPAENAEGEYWYFDKKGNIRIW